MLEPGDQPERDVEQDHDREHRRDRLEQLALHGRELEHQRYERERRHGRHDARTHALEHAAAVSAIAARLEVPQNRRDHQHRLQPFPEEQHERHQHGQERCADPGRAELALDPVEARPELPGDAR